MNYSLEKIGTVETCNTLLALAQKKKEILERRRRNMGEAIARFHGRNANINDELVSVQILLQAYTTAYNILAEGSRGKINMNIKIKRLEVRKARLDRMHVKYSAYSLLRKNVDYYRVDSQVLSIDSYITAVEHKKMALSNSTPLYAAEHKPLKRRPSYNTKISIAFSNPTVVYAKQPSGKSVYSCRTHFSETGCTTKLAIQKKPVQFLNPFSRPGPHPPTIAFSTLIASSQHQFSIPIPSALYVQGIQKAWQGLWKGSACTSHGLSGIFW